MFKNLSSAGRLLAERLRDEGVSPDIALVTSKDAVPVAREVSDELGVEVSALMSKELPAPGRDFVVGATAEDGTIWINDAMVEEFMVGGRYISRVRDRKVAELRKETARLDLERCEPRSKDVLLLAAGIPSPERMAASLGSVKKRGAKNMVAAAPFATCHAREELENLADRIVSVETPRFALGVSEGYEEYDRPRFPGLKKSIPE